MKFRTKDSFKLSCLVLIYLVCELMGVQIAAFSRVGLFFRSYLLLFFPECKAYFHKKELACNSRRIVNAYVPFIYKLCKDACEDIFVFLAMTLDHIF